jgi:hypothetical protein
MRVSMARARQKLIKNAMSENDPRSSSSNPGGDDDGVGSRGNSSNGASKANKGNDHVIHSI